MNFPCSTELFRARRGQKRKLDPTFCAQLPVWANFWSVTGRGNERDGSFALSAASLSFEHEKKPGPTSSISCTFFPFYLLTAVSSSTVLCCARPNLQTHSSGSCGRYSSFRRSRCNLDLIDPDLLLFSDHLRSFLAKTPFAELRNGRINTLTVSSNVARWPLFISILFRTIYLNAFTTSILRSWCDTKKTRSFPHFDRISMNK